MTGTTSISFLYHLILRHLPVDVSRLLWLNTQEFLPAKPVDGAQCRILTATDIQRLKKIKDFGLNDQIAQEFEKQNALGIGIFVHDKLAGISLYFANYPSQQQKNHPYLGSTMSIPPGTRYLHNAFVLPQHRGLKLNSAMVRFAINHLGTDTVHTLITTANLREGAFLSSVLGQGFERVGWTAEGILFGKHFYHLPKPIDSLDGKISTDEEGSVIVTPISA